MAGVVAAKELLQRGCAVTLLEKGPELGGVWREAWAARGRRRRCSTRRSRTLVCRRSWRRCATVEARTRATFLATSTAVVARAYAERFGVLECVICDAEVEPCGSAGRWVRGRLARGPAGCCPIDHETFTHVVVAMRLAHAKSLSTRRA